MMKSPRPDYIVDATERRRMSDEAWARAVRMGAIIGLSMALGSCITTLMWMHALGRL